MPHVEAFFVNTNHANFTKDYNGSVWSRLGATEWTETSRRIRKIKELYL